MSSFLSTLNLLMKWLSKIKDYLFVQTMFIILNNKWYTEVETLNLTRRTEWKKF